MSIFINFLESIQNSIVGLPWFSTLMNLVINVLITGAISRVFDADERPNYYFRVGPSLAFFAVVTFSQAMIMPTSSYRNIVGPEPTYLSNIIYLFFIACFAASYRYLLKSRQLLTSCEFDAGHYYPIQGYGYLLLSNSLGLIACILSIQFI